MATLIDPNTPHLYSVLKDLELILKIPIQETGSMLKIFVSYPEKPGMKETTVKYVTAYVAYVNKDVSKLGGAERYINP